MAWEETTSTCRWIRLHHEMDHEWQESRGSAQDHATCISQELSTKELTRRRWLIVLLLSRQQVAYVNEGAQGQLVEERSASRLAARARAEPVIVKRLLAGVVNLSA